MPWLLFWVLNFKPAFSLSCFTLIKRLLNSSSLDAFRVVSSAYLRLLTFLPAILVPARHFPLYCACKFKKHCDGVLSWCPPFPILNLSTGPCPVLTFFLSCMQVSQEAGQVVWDSHFFKNSPQCVVITHERLSCRPESRSRFFFWNSLAFSMIQWMLTVWSHLTKCI